VIRIRRSGQSPEAGQVLPIFVGAVIAMLAVAALAIDVSHVYADMRFYRSVTDSASLAGGQDLQVLGTRTVTATERTRARNHALESLVSQLNASSTPSCSLQLNGDIRGCALPGTPYVVSIETPSPTCVTCDPDRSIQVTLTHSNYRLSVAGVFGQSVWTPTVASVAGLNFASKYALVTLRPPQPLPNGLDQNRADIDVNGTNTRLNIVRGDVGTNTSAVTNSGGRITLATGYKIHHYDDIVPDPWWKDLSGNPQGMLITSLIPDPDYMYASFPGTTPTFANQAAGVIACPVGTPDWPTGYAAELTGVTCYRPGIYQQAFNVQGAGAKAYLLPGAYRFDRGIDVRTSLFGGLVAGRQGVVMVIPQSQDLTANNAAHFWINIGSEGCAASACRAAPAVDLAGNQVVTSAPGSLTISIEVTRDSSCFSGTTPRLCSDNQNTTLSMPGNGQMQVAGVIYAPSDKVAIAGDNTSQVGVVGQIIAWTVTYSGGARLNQDYPGTEEVGILRLDAACSAPTERCN